MGESGRGKLFASVALFCGIGAIPVCLKLSDGWDFPLFPTLAACAVPVILNAFLSSLPRKRRAAATILEGVPLVFFALFLSLLGKADPAEILRAFGGSGTVRDVSLPLFVSLFFAWLSSSAVFLWKKPGIGALVLAAPWTLAPVLGLRPGILILFLAAFAAWALLRRGGKRGIAFLLLCALLLCSVPLGFALSDPASLLLYRAENALYGWSAGRSDGANAAGGRVSTGSARRAGREVMEITVSRLPGENLYLKSFTGSVYRNGVWREENAGAIVERVRERIGWAGWSDFVASMTDSKYYVLNTVTHGPLVINGSPSVYPVGMKTRLLDRSGVRVEPYYGRETELLPEDGGDAAVRRFEYYETQDMLFRWDGTSSEQIGAWYRTLEQAHRRVIRETCLDVPMRDLTRLFAFSRQNPASGMEEAAALILETLSSETEYALNPGLGSLTSDPVEEFLFVKKRGFCEHYAAAATLLFRLYGVPARYAAGYRISPEDFRANEDGTYTVTITDYDAHAWTEVYLDDFGWTPLEVTPTADGDYAPPGAAFDGETIREMAEAVSAEKSAAEEQKTEKNETKDAPAFRMGDEEEIGILREKTRVALEQAPWEDLIPLLLYAVLWAAILCLRRRGRKAGKGEKRMEKTEEVIREVDKVVLGKEKEVREILTAILAGGHILLEDVPGVGKTTAAMAFARAMQVDMKRVQFTPDVTPSDLTGFTLYRRDEERFVYQPGAVFTNLLLADELNRTSPRTQSALLEVMEEKKVTVDGVTREVPDPFIVIASENPAGAVGTEAIPETQIDRFMVSLSLGYPDGDSERELARTAGENRRETLASPVITCEELRSLRRAVHGVKLDDALADYIVALVTATRGHPLLARGASPRATVALTLTAKASALMAGRGCVTAEDVKEQFPYVVKHRVELSAEARRAGKSREDAVREILARVKEPRKL